jgi:hypothetical protein
MLEAVLTRAIDKEEEICTPKHMAEVLLSVTNQFYLLRIADPTTKHSFYEEIREILAKEFRIGNVEVDEDGMSRKDKENLEKVVRQYNKRATGSIVSMASLDEVRRLLEQIEWGIQK